MKAILVIDMPEKCEDCLLYNGDSCCADIQWYLTGELGYREVWHPEKREDWCPLRPMPEKKPVWRVAEILADNVEEEINSNQTQYARGWNACLNEIGKKEWMEE